ncbi:MAG: hypothetical protein NTZ18_00985 [Candidatus Komeilibacteria bacterium]|nr:hypothetical protein [Candidatus Komeilibacteria bacterium]
MSSIWISLVRGVAKHGGTDEDIIRLNTPEGEETLDRVAELIANANRKAVEPIQLQPLLKLLGTVSIPKTTEPFVVADHFKKGNADGVAISIIWENFQTLCGGVVEEPIKEAIELRYYKLLRPEDDEPIIVELSGEATVETFFAAIWESLKLQKNGGKGKLLTTDGANIFYIRVGGVLLAVRVRWDYFGWRASADSVEYPHWWSAGFRVFSGNSVSLAA